MNSNDLAFTVNCSRTLRRDFLVGQLMRRGPPLPDLWNQILIQEVKKLCEANGLHAVKVPLFLNEDLEDKHIISLGKSSSSSSMTCSPPRLLAFTPLLMIPS